MKPAPFFTLIILLALTGCAFPTLGPTATLIPTGTATVTATIPPTHTPLPTQTSTPTLTPTITLTPTATETPVPLTPASLFPFHDADGNIVDWSYAHVSHYVKSESGSPKDLSGFMAFQLMDRGIHRNTVTYDSQTLTIYYLNVQHEFSRQMYPVKLILSAASGDDKPLELIPAGGGDYVRMRLVPRWNIFDAYSYHRDANKSYAERSQLYPDMLIVDLQKLLPTLPDGLIVLADAPIIFDPDTLGYQVKQDMDTVPYLAARYMPFLALDEYNRITGPTAEASALANLMINLKPIQGGIPYYSSDTLAFILNTGRVPTLP
jgi:hypothetical protein